MVINLDATADNRTGYHYFYEYGNIFLENRYSMMPTFLSISP